MMRQLHAGVIWVNTYKVISPMAPFGGFGLSGHGREGGIEAVLDYTTAKAIWLRTSDSQYPNPFRN
jgi:aldehyde dehydrogenase (NAD+)